ncbi:amino acid ABC transporter substrate-binding protein [Pseudomonas sp. PDM16]|uniref:substrate-binding periplasmic protein n=1 Tax=Pseudomonas sp. PDM16 TaxID=2769292 RepID=UPI00178052DD|nr:transporter substrate-binding domain-containing protein [Pseudomonas sp. PDM16]MBD9413907.1 amino acid ABC transporter substrate-binding protein [Pseudomonas sp. PDM16]
MKGLYGLALVIALLAQAAIAESLRLAGDSWPPFTDRRLPGNGLAVELVSAALKRAGHTSEYVEVPWARVLRGLQQGDYDIVVAAWYSPERARYALFSDTYLINRIRFLRRVGAPIEYEGLGSLRRFSIAVVRGYSYDPAFDSAQDLTRVPVLEFAMGARMLAAGRVQLTLEDELVAQYHLSRGLREIRDAVEFVDAPLSENGLHILVRRSHPLHQQIVREFDENISAMKADGTYRQIFKRHGL